MGASFFPLHQPTLVQWRMRKREQPIFVLNICNATLISRHHSAQRPHVHPDMINNANVGSGGKCQSRHVDVERADCCAVRQICMKKGGLIATLSCGILIIWNRMALYNTHPTRPIYTMHFFFFGWGGTGCVKTVCFYERFTAIFSGHVEQVSVISRSFEAAHKFQPLHQFSL